LPRPQGFSSEFGLATTGWPPAQALAAADDFLAAWLSTLAARQNAYLASHGRYWQGLLTHAAAPAHAANRDDSAAPDRMASRPHYQTEDWLAVLPEWAGLLLPAAVRVDQYVSPVGPGWVLTLELVHGRDRYARSVNVGPEAYRDSPWAVMPLDREGI
jgi:hypothetical protein